MKIFDLLPRLGLAVTLTALTITVANADTINGTATAQVIEPLSINEDSAMDFGSISGGPTIGTVVLTAGSGRSTTGDAQIITVGAGSAAGFTTTGEFSQSYAISYTSGILSDGTFTMIVDTFTDNAAGVLNGSGTETFAVGATLHVGADQNAGAYSTGNALGTPYTITVNYN